MSPGSGLVSGERRFELLLVAAIGAVLLGLTAFAGSLVVAAMTATGALGAGTSLWVLLALLLTVLATGVTAAGAVAWLAWLALAQLRTATVAGYRRLLWTGYRRARTFEERSLAGRLLRPARFFEARGGREGHLVEELKTRYVAGEIDELDFERELGRLLGGGADVGRQVRREIDVTAPEGSADSEERAPDGATETDGVTDGPAEHEIDDGSRERDAEMA